jgi:hypothetical protein
MTSTENPDEGDLSAPLDSPGDIPAERPAALDRLDVLIGRWSVEAVFDADFFGPGTSAVTDRGGLTTFEWLEGRFFLMQRFVNEHPAAPSGITIIGARSDREAFVQRYYDSRGVVRDYQMTLDDGVWRLWREAPGFWQRYRGVISDDGRKITGAWEASADGREWRHDFGLTHIKKQ